tara:strand:+ start:207 stop:494 length:288 start_codon:yes stop_codon:yes gene_type:complete
MGTERILMTKKEKLVMFKCKGSGVVKDQPICKASIVTTIDDKRLEKRGGYSAKVYGKKEYFPISRTYRCDDCLALLKEWEQKVHKKMWEEFSKYL